MVVGSNSPNPSHAHSGVPFHGVGPTRSLHHSISLIQYHKFPISKVSNPNPNLRVTGARPYAEDGITSQISHFTRMAQTQGEAMMPEGHTGVHVLMACCPDVACLWHGRCVGTATLLYIHCTLRRSQTLNFQPDPTNDVTSEILVEKNGLTAL